MKRTCEFCMWFGGDGVSDGYCELDYETVSKGNSCDYFKEEGVRKGGFIKSHKQKGRYDG